MEDAAAFVAGKTPPSELASKGKAKQPDKFYAVAKGRKPGIYTDWDTAQTEAIIGTKGPKYKKFGTLAEAQQYIRLNGSLETIQRLGLLPDVDEDANDEEVSAAPAAKKAKTKTEDSEAEVKIVLPPKASATGLEDGVLHIHTDGSSLDNGSVVARAGVGVFFGHNDPRSVSHLCAYLPLRR
jgi:ribonuclease HI